MYIDRVWDTQSIKMHVAWVWDTQTIALHVTWVWDTQVVIIIKILVLSKLVESVESDNTLTPNVCGLSVRHSSHNYYQIVFTLIVSGVCREN